ncbi:MAG: fibronectin type III domain-containing protein [Myxococcota bacterium]|nr:fibronectin type III domain-containing protein [Myxococcota bacterium]
MAAVVRCAALGALAMALPAHAENKCHVVDVDFMPAELNSGAPMRAASQIVAWVEDSAGQYVDTIFITQQTGTFGLGNRPGRWDFNSGPRWPYGRRIATFPIWAHRRAASGAPTWQEVVFQNAEDSNLSHPFTQSSRDNHFCRPIMSSESMWDAGTCASMVWTDKGELHTSRTSLYPPRNDLTWSTPDAASVETFAMLNPFDAVSMATPPSGAVARLAWPIPDGLPQGNYVLWVEVSREFDHNATYNTTAYPEPPGIPWGEYGEPYRGQPSVVYKVPFEISATESITSTMAYVGYGDPTGNDGTVRPPDATITTGVPGSGAERLGILVDDQSTPYRVRVTARPELDFIAPAQPNNAEINTLTTSSAVVEFSAPGDDGLVGRVRGYEIRYVAGSTLTEDNFASGIELKPDLVVGEPGTLQEFPINGLLFDTEYTVGIRAYDDCRNTGKVALVTFRTPERLSGEVDACFVATAAYGTVLAHDVEMLRRFRDFMLQSTVLGELAVEAYYTFGPAIAGAVGESELLRATSRAVLDPIVRTVKVLRF